MGGGEKKRLQKSYYDVLGICCSSEIPLIEKILKPLEGVKDVSVIVASRTVIVVHDNYIISQLEIAKVLNQARLDANLRVYGGGKEGKYKNRWPSPYAIACGILLLLSFLKYVFEPMKWLALGAVIVGVCPIFLKAVSAVRNRTIDTNILVLIAVIGSIALRDYWEAGTIVFLFTIAQWLEARASHKATAVMSSLMSIVPQKAVIAETGEEVDAGEVKVNTVLAVKAGQTIPIDGIVVDGRCEVDEKTLTGEPFLVSKNVDSTVWAGTINVNGYISVKTTALAEDCVVAKMATLVEEAQNSKSKTQRLIDKCAKYYTPAVVLISAGLAAIPAILRVHNLNHWLHLSLVVLVSACPCALILSTPVATFCALSKAASSGILIKGGEYIETLSKIKIMGFDKTGTITKGEFSVTDFRSLTQDVPLNTLLHWVSSIESKSSHPMAVSLVHYGRQHSIEPMSEEVEEFENFPGEGIHGKIGGKDVFIGNRRIALRAGCPAVPELDDITSGGKSIGYIFLGATPAGIFSLSDSCRTGVKETMNQLKSMHIKIAMLTGDNKESANLLQNQLEGALDVVHAELLPQDKARIIKDFQTEGATAMVGDGLNDTPALATADIGMSMGISGSALATETGQVILMSNDIRKIPETIQLARKTQWKIIQNIILSISTKVAIIALAFAGHPLVWAAVLADVGTCLAVIINSMFILRVKHKHGNEGHTHKEGNHKSHGCHSSHSHQHACSDSKAQADSKLQKCCSKRDGSKHHSTASNLCECAAHEHKHPLQIDSCGYQKEHLQEKGCCEHEHKVQKDVCSANEHKHRDSVCSADGHKNKQEGSLAHKHGDEESGCCKHNHKHSKEAMHLNHETSSSISYEAMHSAHKHNHKESVCDPKHKHSEEPMHLDHERCSRSMEGHQKSTSTQTSHCDKINGQCCVADEEKSNVRQTCCTPHRLTNDPIPEGSNDSCSDTASCQSFKRREIGGCCSSYRKQCCSRNGNFDPVSLTEIIVE